MNITKNIALERQKPHTASDIEINYSQSCAGFRHCNRPGKIKNIYEIQIRIKKK